MSKRYLKFSNGSKIAISEPSDPKNELRGNSPVPDQHLGNGFAIKDGQIVGLNFKGGSVADTQELIDQLVEKATADFKKLNFKIGIPASAGKNKTRH